MLVLIEGCDSLREEEMKRMEAKVEETAALLKAAGVKVTTDCRSNYTPGWKYNHWELKVCVDVAADAVDQHLGVCAHTRNKQTLPTHSLLLGVRSTGGPVANGAGAEGHGERDVLCCQA